MVQDLATKQTFEEDRMEDTRTAALTSCDIDEMDDLIIKLAAVIAQCVMTIERSRQFTMSSGGSHGGLDRRGQLPEVRLPAGVGD